jgi:hypothetical protein
MSVVPPGANGTTMRTGLPGQAFCAVASPVDAIKSRATKALFKSDRAAKNEYFSVEIDRKVQVGMAGGFLWG